MRVSRRHVLKGLGGAALSLPLLEGLIGTRAFAQAQEAQRFAIFLRQGCGVATEQNSPLASGREPERFWPRNRGPLTAENLEGRALDELTAYASRILVADGVNREVYNYGDGHANGALQALTAAGPLVPGQGGESEANGESIDNFIGRKLNPEGRDSLFMYAGREGGWLGGPCISYRSAGVRRSAYSNPYTAFRTIMGGEGAGDADDAAAQAAALRRTSINDLVRDQLQGVLRNPKLSRADRSRLELHLSNVRDIELQLGCGLDEAREAELAGAEAFYNSSDGENTLRTLRLHMDVAAMAVACGYTRSVAIQVGDGNDGQTRYYDESGNPMENYHYISHRRLSHDDTGSVIEGSDWLHHLVDRHFARSFKHLIERLDAYEVAGGGSLLDQGVAIWYNDNANGPAHSSRRVPTVLAGSAQGYFRQGECVDVALEGTNASRFLNTVATAVGVTKDDGSPIDDFGTDDQPRGLMDALKA